MTDWRYWITYEGVLEAPDEDVARLAAAGKHSEALQDETCVYLALVEVEAIDNAGN